MRLLILLILLIPGYVFGAPFLVSDPDPSKLATVCAYQFGTAAPVRQPTVNNACHVDLAGLPPGNDALQVWFETAQGVPSAQSPFTYIAPPAPWTGPPNIRVNSQ